MHRTLVLNVVGLTPRLLGRHTPHLSALAEAGGLRPLKTISPALTCSVQSTFVTGLLPREHGIVGNGWYFRELSEVWLWRQSNRLVNGEKVWEAARAIDPSFTCANAFWWYNMYSSADYSVTPRPMYLADGRKLPDIYSEPPELRDELQGRLGQFPLFNFWGPNADIVSSRWIVQSASHIYDIHHPTLMMVYVPHLDYCLQKLGPKHDDIARHLREVDAVCGEIIEHVQKDGTRVIVLSEYGITEVSNVVHINRALRNAGMLRVRIELGRELLDPGASTAFAVADHQVAHVYIRDRERTLEVKKLIEELNGVEVVLDEDGKRAYGLDHPRAGELVAFSRIDCWFSYYYWTDDDRAPDFARTVEIHRKPGYDPVEMFLDPQLHFPRLQVAWRLGKKFLGFRSLMDVIPLDASLVAGSHGRVTDVDEEGPLFVTSQPDLLPPERVEAGDVKGLILEHVFEPRS